MSRVLHPRRARNTTRGTDTIYRQPEQYHYPEKAQRNNNETTDESVFDEMTKNKQGESVIDLSEGISTVTIDKKSLRKINDLNLNPSDRPPGEEIYEDVFKVGSDYKTKMIQDMINDVKRQTQYLYEDDNNEYRSYEDQLRNSSVTTSTATQRKYIAEARNIVAKNDGKMNKK